MKITKEKVIYFLSLNIVPLFIVFIFTYYPCYFAINDYLKSKMCLLIFPSLFFSEIFIFLASIRSFFYAKQKRENYNIFSCSLHASFMILLLLLIFSVFLVFLTDVSLSFEFGVFLLEVFVFVFIFALVILKITDPLRKKIVW